MYFRRSFLMAGVSGVALVVVGQSAMAADLPPRAPMITKAPPVAPFNPWTWSIEGGLQAISGGDAHVLGFSDPFATPAKKWGWNVAGSVDYRLDAAWHVSAAFRYGRNKSRTNSSSPVATFNIPTATSTTTTAVTPVAIAGTNSATRKEHNWVADFAVGRDIGLGMGASQLKLGLRVAEIRGKTEGSASWNVPTTASTTAAVTHTRSYVQTNRFLGVGPRVALEGNAPLVGAWSVDYMGGVAALYAHRSVDQTVTATTGVSNANIAPVCISGCPVASSSSSDGFVFNADAMLGLAYAITPNAKMSANYRVDYYGNALRVIDSANNAVNVSRLYHGPNLRLTVKY